ncbi:MAG: hypothetical protein EOP54_02720 [Sphingobacteriales bacterium]|nr:MAG: hypothetical protein EOP54_02720 [Sphingobacteriales bacterium]
MKSRQAIKRLKSRGTKNIGLLAQHPSGGPRQTENPLSVKEAEAILIDVSLRELYNNGDKRDLDFVHDILEPNKIMIPQGQPLESFWDIITNTGLMQAVIGFGKHGRLTLTQEGYQLMNRYGSYGNFLQKKHAKIVDADTNIEDVTPPPPPPKEPMDGVH